MTKKAKILKSMLIAETIRKYPATAFVFLNYDLHCARCPMSGPETIEEAAELHQVGLKQFLADLNAAAEKTKKRPRG